MIKSTKGKREREWDRTAQQFNPWTCRGVGCVGGWFVTLVRAPPAMTWRVKMNPPLQGCWGSSRLSTEYLTSSSHSTHTHTCTAQRAALGTYKICLPMFPMKSQNSTRQKRTKTKTKNAGLPLRGRTCSAVAAHRMVKQASSGLTISLFLTLCSVALVRSLSLSCLLAHAQAVLNAEAADVLGSLQPSVEPPSRMAGPGARYWLSLCQSDTLEAETAVEVGEWEGHLSCINHLEAESREDCCFSQTNPPKIHKHAP